MNRCEPPFSIKARVLSEPIGGFCELTGTAGDVVLGHPFGFHARGHKRPGPRGDSDYSILERSIVTALVEPPPPVPVDGILCRF